MAYTPVIKLEPLPEGALFVTVRYWSAAQSVMYCNKLMFRLALQAFASVLTTSGFGMAITGSVLSTTVMVCEAVVGTDWQPSVVDHVRVTV